MARAQERVKARVRNRPERDSEPVSRRDRPRQVRSDMTVAEVRRGAVTERRVGKETVHRAETDHSADRLTREVPAIHAKVGVGGSSTVNIGDYNSVQVRCWIEIPCAPTDADVREAYQEASDYVEEWIQKELDAAAPQD